MMNQPQAVVRRVSAVLEWPPWLAEFLKRFHSVCKSDVELPLAIYLRETHCRFNFNAVL